MGMEPVRTQVRQQLSEDRTKTEEGRTPSGSRAPYGDVQRLAGRSWGRLLSSGEYRDWAYGEIVTRKPKCVVYVCAESGEGNEAQKQRQEWARLKEHIMEKEALAKSARS